jgi:hypothetical protein
MHRDEANGGIQNAVFTRSYPWLTKMVRTRNQFFAVRRDFPPRLFARQGGNGILTGFSADRCFTTAP